MRACGYSIGRSPAPVMHPSSVVEAIGVPAIWSTLATVAAGERGYQNRRAHRGPRCPPGGTRTVLRLRPPTLDLAHTRPRSSTRTHPLGPVLDTRVPGFARAVQGGLATRGAVGAPGLHCEPLAESICRVVPGSPVIRWKWSPAWPVATLATCRRAHVWSARITAEVDAAAIAFSRGRRRGDRVQPARTRRGRHRGDRRACPRRSG